MSSHVDVGTGLEGREVGDGTVDEIIYEMKTTAYRRPDANAGKANMHTVERNRSNLQAPLRDDSPVKVLRAYS